MTKLIRVTDAASRLGVHRQTLENWAAKGIVNIKKMRNAHYIDADLIEKISDLATDVEKSRQELEKLKEEYSKEEYELNRLRVDLLTEHKDLNDERRYLNLCAQGGIRSRFFQSVLSLMECYGSLTCRESDVLCQRLEGVSLEEIGKKHGLKRERVRQIVEKAIRKSRDITDIKDLFDVIRKYQADIEGYKATIKDLKGKLRVQEEADRLAAEKSLEERRKKIIENDELCKLLSRRLVDCGLSVRALGCLRSEQRSYWDGTVTAESLETVGDLCKQNKTDVLKRRNCGKKTLTEIDDMLEQFGLKWGMDVDRIYKERVEILMAQEEDGETEM